MYHFIYIIFIFSHAIPLCLLLIIIYVYFQAAEQAASRPGELGYTIALAARYLHFHIRYSINANIRFRTICQIVCVFYFYDYVVTMRNDGF